MNAGDTCRLFFETDHMFIKPDILNDALYMIQKMKSMFTGYSIMRRL
jgi:hypothetical protein